MKKNNCILGQEAENIAYNYLQDMGYTMLERNFRCKLGEIDIIALNDGYIVFIEVKYRHNSKCGYPREAVNYYKQRNITKVATYYLVKKGAYNKSCRFDVVEITGDNIELIKNAFDAVY